MRAYLVAAGVLAAIPIFAALQDSHTIKWVPTVGQKSTYKVEVDGQMEIPGAGAMDMHFEIVTDSTIKDLTDDKVTVVGRLADMKILIGGNDVMSMTGQDLDEMKKKEVTETFNLKGVRLSSSETEENPGQARFGRMTNLIYPDNALAMDESWTAEVAADSAKGLPALRSKYTFKGFEEVEGKKYTKIEFTTSELSGEKPMGAIGVMLLESETGRAFRVTADVNDAQFDPQMPPTNVKYSLKLQ